MTGYWLVTAAHIVQIGLIALAVLAYLAVARDIAQEVRGQ